MRRCVSACRGDTRGGEVGLRKECSEGSRRQEETRSSGMTSSLMATVVLLDGSFPMNQRSFPPSFWNSSYQPSSSLGSALSSPHSELSFPGDPYASSSSLHSHLHQPSPDSWHPSHHHHHHHHHPYSLGGAIGSQGSAYPRPGVHEMYSTAFDPRYGSLLVPSVRNHHRVASGSSVPSASPCDLGGKGESGTSSWSGAFTGAGAEIGLNMDTGLQAQDKSKDLYWF
ncbi:transcription cofactor vestigial-like protein 2a [Notothenia coriiceps]|uniref:Transcription cofactor vestigial-like protein 2a n=1 Tax=Notothenia coriiceps TaxID=8208 RepID=A0A6I9Q0U1_9TELE|nr:PREDICTED: transcription cofactor vestigial-like protein 2 [Notothenia coriiceps]